MPFSHHSQMAATAPDDLQRLCWVRLEGECGLGKAFIDLARQAFDLAPGEIDGSVTGGLVSSPLFWSCRTFFSPVSRLGGGASIAVRMVAPLGFRAALGAELTTCVAEAHALGAVFNAAMATQSRHETVQFVFKFQAELKLKHETMQLG
jgi:hypothetical protein